MWLFLLLVGVPILEIGLFIEVGGAIGLWPTLAIVIGTALAGTILLRAQGRGALVDLQSRLQKGGDPSGPIAHGAMILVAGVLLLTPGFFTDAVGFALLLPPVRTALMRWGATRFAAGVRSGRVTIVTAGGTGPRPSSQGDVIDGDWSREDGDDDSKSSADATELHDDGARTRPGPGASGWTKP